MVLRDTSFLSEEELPRNNAISMMMNTAPPTIQTHGWAYHSVVVVVVVCVVTVELLEPVLSWANAYALARHNKIIAAILEILLQILFII